MNNLSDAEVGAASARYQIGVPTVFTAQIVNSAKFAKRLAWLYPART